MAAALALLLAAPGAETRLAEALRAGEAAWAARADAARLAEARDRFAEAAALAPGEPAAEVPLSRAEALRAMADPAAAEAAWLASMRAAERALRRLAPGFAAAVDRGDPVARAAGEVGRDGAEALYLWGQGAAGLARQRGFGALLAAGPSVAAALSRAAELDERVDRGGPRRALGSWLAALPSAAGGGAGRARREFARARALAPEDLLCRVREAESLAVLLQDPALFDRLLAEVLAFDLRRAPEAAAENALAQRQARELLARRDRLF